MLNLLRNRSFSMFFASRSIANIADSIYLIVVLWMVQTTTHNTSYTALTYTLVSISSAFSLFYGPLLDRFSPSKLAGIALMAQAVIVAFMPSVKENIGLLLGLLFVAVLFSALYYPANNTILPRLIKDKDEVFAANTLVSSSDELINVVSFMLGGSIVVLAGMQGTIYLSAALLLAASVIYMYLARRLRPAAAEPDKEAFSDPRSRRKLAAYWQELKEGLGFIASHPLLKLLMPFFMLTNFAFAAVIVLIPGIGEEYGSALYFSGIFVISLIGFIIGAILMNALRKSGVVLILFWIGEGLALILYDMLPYGFWWKSIAILLFGICTGVTSVLLTSFIQITTPENKMGRVMSALPSITNLSVPLGSLLGGALGHFFSPDQIFLMGGIFMTASAFALLGLKPIRTFDPSSLPSGAAPDSERPAVQGAL